MEAQQFFTGQQEKYRLLHPQFSPKNSDEFFGLIFG